MSISVRKTKENAFSESGTSPTAECSDISSHGTANVKDQFRESARICESSTLVAVFCPC